MYKYQEVKISSVVFSLNCTLLFINVETNKFDNE